MLGLPLQAGWSDLFVDQIPVWLTSMDQTPSCVCTTGTQKVDQCLKASPGG